MARVTNRFTDEEYKHEYGLTTYTTSTPIPGDHECHYRVFPKGSPAGAFTQTTTLTADGLAFVIHLKDTSSYVGKHELEMKITIPTQVSAIDIERVEINFKA